MTEAKNRPQRGLFADEDGKTKKLTVCCGTDPPGTPGAGDRPYGGEVNCCGRQWCIEFGDADSFGESVSESVSDSDVESFAQSVPEPRPQSHSEPGAHFIAESVPEPRAEHFGHRPEHPGGSRRHAVHAQ